MPSGIYSIVNLTNGHQYIGSAENIQIRWVKHKSQLELNKHKNLHLQASYNKYGAVFELRILEIINDLDGLIPAEQLWIDYAKGLGIVLYNIRKKAESNKGIKFSIDARKHISESKKGKAIGIHAGHYTWLGRKHSEETKARMRKPKPFGFAENMLGSRNPNFKTGKYQKVDHCE